MGLLCYFPVGATCLLEKRNTCEPLMMSIPTLSNHRAGKSDAVVCRRSGGGQQMAGYFFDLGDGKEKQRKRTYYACRLA